LTKRKSEVSREKLLSAAERLFAANGYHGTTVSQIVSEAGLTQAAYYLYFKSKEEILDVMIRAFEQRLVHFVDRGRQIRQKPISEVEDYLFQSYIDLFQLFGANKNVTKIVFNEGGKGEELRNKIVNQISVNMSENQSLGIIRAEVDTKLLAELVVASIESIVTRYSMDEEEEYSPETLGRSFGGIICHGVLKGM